MFVNNLKPKYCTIPPVKMRTYSRKREGGVYVQNYAEKCRLCLCKGTSMTPIFPEGSEEITSVLANRIMLCVGLVTIQDENLPSNICSECYDLLEKCYAFRKLCQSSYQKLKSHLLAVRCIKHMEKYTTEDKCDQSVVILEKTNSLKDKGSLINSPFTSKSIMPSQSLLKPFTADDQVLLLERTNYLTHNVKAEPTSILKQCLQNTSPKRKPYITNNTQNSTPERHSKLSGESTNKIELINSYIDGEMANMSSTVEIPVLHKIKKSQLNLHHSSSYNANNGIEQMDDNDNDSKLVLVLNPSAENNMSLKQYDVAQKGVEMQILEPFQSQELQPHGKVFKEELIVDGADIKISVPEVQETEEENISRDLMAEMVSAEQEESRAEEVTSFIRASLEAVDIMYIHSEVVKLNEEGVTVELVTEDGTLVTLVLEEDCHINQEETVVLPSQINIEIPAKKNKVNKVPVSLDTGCDICGKSFSSRSAALRHRRLHSGHKPYTCHVCQRHFAQREVCERHTLVHREKRPFTCTECPKSFTQRVAMVNHIRSHQDPSNRPLTLHRCNKCPKMFLHASGLTRHAVVHTDKYYVCELCDRKFRDRSSLLRHMKRTKHKNDNTRFIAT